VRVLVRGLHCPCGRAVQEDTIPSEYPFGSGAGGGYERRHPDAQGHHHQHARYSSREGANINATTAGLVGQGGSSAFLDRRGPPPQQQRFVDAGYNNGGGSGQQRKWVPPSAKRDDVAQSNAQHDAIFRRVRGILNKLTPEKFEKLTADILNVGLDSVVVLKGVILLIFEKALDEPKYSSMYAQLCKRLADHAPNFDAPDSETTTFRRLLLSKCRDEFENRSKIAQQYERMVAAGIGAGSSAGLGAAGDNGGSNADEQIDASFLAKHKMLGNIKFIGELGKLQIVHDSILHQCCEKLLVGRRKQPISDQAEDLECLCHLMKTCGRILDTPKARVRMDQYFDRLKQIVSNDIYPMRIRFLIQDVVEMRRNKWMPRKIGKTPEGPRTIQQVREDAYRDGCIYMPQQSPPNNAKTGTSLSSMMGGGGGGGMGGPGGFLNPLEGSFFDSKPRNGGGKKKSDIFGGGYMQSSSGGGYMGSGAPGVIGGNEINDQGSQPRDPPHFDGGKSNGFHAEKGSSSSSGRGQPQQREMERPQAHANFNNRDGRGGGRRSNNDDASDFPAPGGPDFSNYHRRDKPQDFGDRFSANRTKNRDGKQSFEGGRKLESARFSDPSQRSGGGVNGKSPNGSFGQAKGDPNPMGNLPPRFKKMVMNQPQTTMTSNAPSVGPPGGAPPGSMNLLTGSQDIRVSQQSKDAEVSLRPQSAANMLFKPKTPSMLPKSAIRGANDSSSMGGNSLLGPQLPLAPGVVMMQQEAPIMIKQAPLDKGKGKDKGKSNKGPTREQVFSRVEAILADLIEGKNVDDAVQAWRENGWLPSKMNQTAVTHVFKVGVLGKTEAAERALSRDLIAKLVADGALNATHCQEAFDKHISELEKTQDSQLWAAEAASWLVGESMVTLKDLSELLRGDQHGQSLVFLMTLQHLVRADGQDKLKEAFDASDVKLRDHVHADSDDALAETLESHDLGFLAPLLGVQRQMAAQLPADNEVDPTQFGSWLQENVPQEFRKQPEFVMAMFRCVLRHITYSTTLKTPESLNDKAATEAEKELLTKFRPVLQPFVSSQPALQLSAVYALQLFSNERDYPKGLLLRLFVNCYELDIMDEQAFLKWKEDVNDAFPGKGKALFQVRLFTHIGKKLAHSDGFFRPPGEPMVDVAGRGRVRGGGRGRRVNCCSLVKEVSLSSADHDNDDLTATKR